jgi:hypothetical protein
MPSLMSSSLGFKPPGSPRRPLSSYSDDVGASQLPVMSRRSSRASERSIDLNQLDHLFPADMASSKRPGDDSEYKDDQGDNGEHPGGQESVQDPNSSLGKKRPAPADQTEGESAKKVQLGEK